MKKEEEKAEKEAESGWKPIKWRRSQALVAYILFSFLMTIFIEFSFSNTFQFNQYQYLAVIKLIGLVFEILIIKVGARR